MKLNGENFVKRDLDSLLTIKERIALPVLLPEYIKLFSDKNFENEITSITDVNEDMYSLSILGIYNKYTNEYKTKNDMEGALKELNNYFPEMSIEDFFNTWYYFVLMDAIDRNPFLDVTTHEFIKKHKLREIYSIDEFKKKYTERIKQLTLKVHKDNEQFSFFDKQKLFHTTPVEIIKIKTEVEFEVNYDIYELFNNLKMSVDIPYAVIENYYKILDEFKPPERWTYIKENVESDFTEKNDVLYIKVLNKKNTDFTKQVEPDFYTTVSIYFESPKQEKLRKRLERLRKEEKDIKKREKEIEEGLKKKEKKTFVRRGQNVKDIEQKQKEEDDKNRKKLLDERKELEQRKKNMYFHLDKNDDDPILNICKVYMRLESDVHPDLNEQDLIQRIFNSFPTRIENFTKKQIQIKAEFLIPDFYLDKYLFLDVVMNNKLFYNNCFVDERLQIGKLEGEGVKKGGVYMHYALGSDDPENKHITVSMTEQVVEKTNLKIIKLDPLLKVDTNYLKVRITKAKDYEEAVKFQQLFSKYITIYNDLKKSLIDKYSKYIDDFTDFLQQTKTDLEQKRKKSQRKNMMLKDYEPDLFVSGYTRSCPQPRLPRIVDEDEKKKLESEGKYVMLYPKNNIELGKEYKQFYYACDHNKPNPYPSLKINKLLNKDSYPIVPCCYNVDYRNKPKSKSLWRLYYENDKNFSDFSDFKVENDEDETHIYSTNKILPPRRLGYLIKDLDTFFKSIDIHNNYFRMGVSRSVDSIIECLLLLKDPEVEILPQDEKDDLMTQTRLSLLDLLDKTHGHQQTVLFSRDIELIKSYLLDNNKYLDPKLFISFLEEFFNVNIYIFSQNEDHPFGFLNCPFNINEYLKWKDSKKKNNSVFIYEHTGNDFSNNIYPQCELIIRMDEKGKKDISFPFDFEVSKRINTIFDMMYRNEPDRQDDKFNLVNKVLSQGIDYNGKCRFLQFKELCVYTNPLPPLSVPLGYKYEPVNLNVILKFLHSEGIEGYEKHIVDNKCVGIQSGKDNILFYIPVIPFTVENMNRDTYLLSPILSNKSDQKSILNSYNNFERLSRYIIEYTLYFFSIDYHKYKPNNPISVKYFKEFIDRNIEIDPTFSYGKIPRIFSSTCEGIIKNNKIIVPNEKVINKLIYNLRLHLRNNYNEVINYKEYKYIKHYYKNIKDFEQIPNQVIIYGQDALHKWVSSKSVDYTLNDKVKVLDYSLYDELLNKDNGLPFIVIFMAPWHKPSMSLISSIDSDKVVFGKTIPSMFNRYGSKFNFIYVDIDKNKNLTELYNVSNIPFIYFLKIEDNKLITLDRIIGKDSTYENLRLLSKSINNILDKQ